MRSKTKKKENLFILLTSLVLITVAMIALFIVNRNIGYQGFTPPTSDFYSYESHFDLEEMGVLNTSYWIYNASQNARGYHVIENDMLKLHSDNAYQVGYGMYWTEPTYEHGGYEPWLSVYWRYHSEIVFVNPKGVEMIPNLCVENWIAYDQYKSYTAMVWYEHGYLTYSVYPRGIKLDYFELPHEFRVVIDVNYKTKDIHIEWADHIYDRKMGFEPIGTVSKPWTHFQIFLTEVGEIYIKSVKVWQWDSEYPDGSMPS